MTRALWLKIRALLARERAERDLHDELDFHIEMQARKHRAAGVDADEAMRLARLEFGNVSVAKDDARDTRRLWMFEDLAQDVRYATRALRRAPAFALAIIVTIGLGVGLNASVFTIFNAYVLRPFEVRRRVREPEIWIVHVTRQATWRPPTDRLDGREIEAERRVHEPGGFGAYLAGVVHVVLQQVVIRTPRSRGPG